MCTHTRTAQTQTHTQPGGDIVDVFIARTRNIGSRAISNISRFQARGNIDCIVGDQTFVTFNAHIPCGDIAMAAVNAALSQLSASRGSSF